MMSAICTISCPMSDNQSNDIFQSYKFPSYSQATHLCGKNVSANVAEIRWDAFSSNDPVEQVISFYEGKLGKEGFKREGDKGEWKFPVNSDKPERIIEIMPVGAKAPYQGCEKSPSSHAKSIIMLSQMTRKK